MPTPRPAPLLPKPVKVGPADGAVVKDLSNPWHPGNGIPMEAVKDLTQERKAPPIAQPPKVKEPKTPAIQHVPYHEQKAPTGLGKINRKNPFLKKSR